MRIISKTIIDKIIREIDNLKKIYKTKPWVGDPYELNQIYQDLLKVII